MTKIEHAFLISGEKWDSVELQNLSFNFATATSAIVYLQPDFYGDYKYLTDAGSVFSASADPSIYDQKDVVRFLLLNPDTLGNFIGNQTVNSNLVNTANTTVSNGAVNYRVSFADVILAGFSEDVNGEVQLINHEGNTPQVASIAFLPAGLAAGDIVINELDPVREQLSPGQGGFWLLAHELGHAVGGLKDVADTPQASTYLDSMKYTMMSYNTYGGVYASGLQLLDVSALQETYGTVNTSTRSDDTTYALGQGLGFYGATANSAFLYTIWDGGGIDKIDASAFNVGAEIDLREGRFSSIGKDASGNAWATDLSATPFDPDPGNVAIAYGVVVENAVGTAYSDTIIGNDVDNVIEGGTGADEAYGGAGNDVFIASANAAGNALEADVYEGGTGSDAADYSGLGFGVRLAFPSAPSGAEAVVQQYNSANNTASGTANTLYSIERYTLTAQDDAVAIDGRTGAVLESIDAGAGGNDRLSMDGVTYDAATQQVLGTDGHVIIDLHNATGFDQMSFNHSTLRPDAQTDAAYNYAAGTLSLAGFTTVDYSAAIVPLTLNITQQFNAGTGGSGSYFSLLANVDAGDHAQLFTGTHHTILTATGMGLEEYVVQSELPTFIGSDNGDTLDISFAANSATHVGGGQQLYRNASMIDVETGTGNDTVQIADQGGDASVVLTYSGGNDSITIASGTTTSVLALHLSEELLQAAA